MSPHNNKQISFRGNRDKFVAKDVEKLDPSYTVGVAVIRCGHFLKINLKVAQHVRIQINKRPTPS